MSTTQHGGGGKTLWPLYAARLYRQGGQLIFPLYRAIVNELQVKPGDLVLVRVHLPYVTFRIAHAPTAMPVERFNPDELPPDYKEALAAVARLLI